MPNEEFVWEHFWMLQKKSKKKVKALGRFLPNQSQGSIWTSSMKLAGEAFVLCRGEVQKQNTSAILLLFYGEKM